MSNPYQAPISVDANTNKLEFELASRWQRLGGVMIDGVIATIITMPAMFYFGFFEYIKNGQEPPFQLTLSFSIIGFFIFLALHGYLLSTSGQTIGKRVVGTKIVSLENELLSLQSVVGKRYLPIMVATQIPLVGQFVGFIDMLFIFGKQKRCLHDLIAGTKVVKA